MQTDQQAHQLRDHALEQMWQGNVEAAIELYDQAALLAETEDLQELITIGKAEALIALEREGAEVSALPAIVMRRRSPRHVYYAAYALMRKFEEAEGRPRALFYGEIARQAAIELGEPLPRTNVLNGVGIILTADSRFSDAIAAFDEALAVLATLREHPERAASLRNYILANLGGAKILSGEIKDGMRLVEGVLPQLTEAYERTEACLDLCFGYLELGQLEAAELFGQEALERATFGRQVRNANHLMGEITLRTGRYDEADKYFDVVAGFYPDYRNVKELLVTVDLCAVVNWKG
jgi:tetratricopeptide (TPR) repeat protein